VEFLAHLRAHQPADAGHLVDFGAVAAGAAAQHGRAG
jgi:hypothetical protein